uniref:Uncharacterized protein MANES_01G112500 n=1 Tax=Rhizophora mucronata TaxID=61149 RepID=A0A2P2JBD8_RHIMU
MSLLATHALGLKP